MSDTAAAGSFDQKCQWCGGIHGPQCPSVKAVEYYPDGSVKRVEFKGPSDFGQTWTMPWPLPDPIKGWEIT